LGRAGKVRKKNFKFLSKVVNLSDMKFLGLIIDENLNWKPHIESLINKITPIIYAIRRIRPLINLDAALQLYYAQIYSHLNYMNPLWNVASDDSIKPLAILQRKALRFIFQKDPRCHNAELFNENILPLELLIDYHLLTLAFKLKHNMIRNNIPIRYVRDIYNYNTRQTNYFYINNYQTPDRLIWFRKLLLTRTH
jgi:hypothetical protein